MCANFKLSPISPGRYKRGFGIFRRLLLTPTLKLTSAAIKDVKEMGQMPAKGTVDKKPAMTLTQKENALKIRELGLQQCHEVNELLNLADSRKLQPLDTAAIMKLSSVSGRYLNKGTYCNVDFYSFASGFIVEQIESVKKEQTRLEYQRAMQILQRLMNGDKALVIVDDNSNRD